MASDNEKLKRKVRSTSKWKKFRNDLVIKRKVDALTGKKLQKGCQLHHADMSPDNYADFDESKYYTLNKNSHRFIHFIYQYFENDESVLDRLRSILEHMKRLNYGQKI